MYCMKRPLAIALAGAALLAAGSALACNPDDFSTAGITACMNAQYKQADRVLGEQFWAAQRDLPDQRSDIKAVQRAWQSFRDQYCAARVDSEEGGREAPLVRLSCLTQLTSARIGELVYYRTGLPQDGYYRAASVDPQVKELFDERFTGEHLNGERVEYIAQNCKLAQRLHDEAPDDCQKRMAFQVTLD